MSVLFIAIPVALLTALIAILAFVAQVRNGQYDDLETPPHRMLFDDEPPQDRESNTGSTLSIPDIDNL